MADVYNKVAGTDENGNPVLVGGNARKVTKRTLIGTPPLVFVNVAAVHDGAPVNFSTNFEAANSNFAKAVLALQGFGEVFMVGAPNSTSFTVLMNSSTVNNGAANESDGSFGDAEAVVKAAIAADTSVTITQHELVGATLAPLAYSTSASF
jgi:hypothetical protein